VVLNFILFSYLYVSEKDVLLYNKSGLPSTNIAA